MPVLPILFCTIVHVCHYCSMKKVVVVVVSRDRSGNAWKLASNLALLLSPFLAI